MKKILLLIVFVTFVLPVFAENFFEPEWSEFAPSQYKEISVSKQYFSPNKRYWAERRKNFEKRLLKCNSYSNDRQTECYNELRNLEMNASMLRAENVRNNNLNHMLINSMF